MTRVSTSISTSTTAFVATKLSIVADLKTQGGRSEPVVALVEGVVGRVLSHWPCGDGGDSVCVVVVW